MERAPKRSYRKTGLDFLNLDFSSKAERAYVKRRVESVARQVREMRLRRNLSQEQLAELTSVSVGTIKYIELNQRSPSLAVLFKILYVLDREAIVLN